MFRTSYVQGQELSSTCFERLMFIFRNCPLHVSNILCSRSGIVCYMFRTSYVQGQELSSTCFERLMFNVRNCLLHFRTSYVQGQELSSTCFEHLMFIFRKTILYIQPYLVCFPCLSYNKFFIRYLSIKTIKVCCAVPQPTAPPRAPSDIIIIIIIIIIISFRF